MRYENKVVKVDRENIDELKSIIGVSGPAGRGQGGGYHHDLSDSVRSRPEALSGDDMVDCG